MKDLIYIVAAIFILSLWLLPVVVVEEEIKIWFKEDRN